MLAGHAFVGAQNLDCRLVFFSLLKQGWILKESLVDRRHKPVLVISFYLAHFLVCYLPDLIHLSMVESRLAMLVVQIHQESLAPRLAQYLRNCHHKEEHHST